MQGPPCIFFKVCLQLDPVPIKMKEIHRNVTKSKRIFKDLHENRSGRRERRERSPRKRAAEDARVSLCRVGGLVLPRTGRQERRERVQLSGDRVLQPRLFPGIQTR